MPKIEAADARKGLGIQVEPVRDICAYYFGYEALTPERRELIETSWGYKSKCVRLLQQLCGVSKASVKGWGAGLDFGKIPPIRLAQLTILMLRSKLEKYREEIRQKDEQIRGMSQKIDALQQQLRFARRSA
jgi:hypothetical protein